ncbi:MAG: flagellar basal body rod protein FlgC [bacterium]
MEIRDFFSTLDISSAALDSYKTQLALTAENIANASTTRTREGSPYKRKALLRKAIEEQRIFSNLLNQSRLKLRTSKTHHIAQDSFRPHVRGGNRLVDIEQEITEKEQFKKIYDPQHPDADKEGFVQYPDINVVWEMLELITASRAYESNLTVMNAAKNLARQALDI